MTFIYFSSKSKNKNRKFIEKIDNLRIEKSQLISDLMRQGNQIHELENKLKECRQDVFQYEQKMTIIDTSNEFKPLNNLSDNNLSKANLPIYFTIPSSSIGNFELRNLREVNDGKCFYSIKEISDTKGELSYLSSERDLQALDSYSNYLLPVCDIVNFENKENAKKIEMIEKGSVLLLNESWVIDINKKVKIRFV